MSGDLRIVSPPKEDEEILDDDPRPEIKLGTDLARVVDESVAALAADQEIYVRGGNLVRVITSDGSDDKIKRAVGAPVIRLATRNWIHERLSVHARFLSRNKDVWRYVQAPSGIAAHVVERGTWPGFRQLVGVVTCPTLRLDGSLLQTPGYDAATGLIYAPGSDYRPVPECPSRGEAEAARDLLLDVFVDFPIDLQGRAGCVALVLTLLARDLIPGSVPMFAVNAPVAGAGKGLVCNIAHRIAHGVDCAHMSMPENDAEIRKQITTTLLSGDPVVLIDNVSRPVGGDSLDAVITAPIWKVRLLGKMEDSGAIAPRVVWLMTGRGIELVGDLGRRTLMIHLEPPTENPEERDDYTHPDRAGTGKLLAYVANRRGDLVHAGLTCLRAWHVDGRHGTTKPWGSFEGWCETIGACVVWLDLPDPTLSRASSDAAIDPTKRALAVVYEAIRRLTADNPRGVTAGEITNAAEPKRSGEPTGYEDLAEAIAELAPNGDARAKARVLGHKLKVGRIIDGMKLTQIAAGCRVVRYRVT